MNLRRLLEIGDVISLESGHKVYYKSNNKSYTTDVRINDQNYPELIGEYVVISTEFSGSGYGHGGNDSYPNGHRVFCKKLNNQKWDTNGTEVNFYQSGCFTAMIKNIDPIRKMTMSFS